MALVAIQIRYRERRSSGMLTGWAKKAGPGGRAALRCVLKLHTIRDVCAYEICIYSVNYYSGTKLLWHAMRGSTLNLYLHCDNCGHQRPFDLELKNKLQNKFKLPINKNLEHALMKHVDSFKCGECGAKEIKVRQKINPWAASRKKNVSLRRYADSIERVNEKLRGGESSLSNNSKAGSSAYNRTEEAKKTDRESETFRQYEECMSRKEPAFKKRYIDEGIAGTREDNKRMRGKLWGEIKNRNKK